MFDSLLPVSSRQALLFCLLISLFELLIYVASDVVMPGMLTVVTDLNADPRYVPLSLNAYLLGGVAFQWLIGPLSDRFGRRPLLLVGCAIFTFSCLLTPWVKHIEIFTALRFIQGTGLGFVIVVSYPALQESFNEANAVRLMAVFSNIALLSPLLGPLAGSVLFSLISWHELFIVIAAFGAIIWLGLFFLMPETINVLRKDGSKIPPQPLQAGAIYHAYIDLLKNRRFIYGSIAVGLTGLPLVSWLAISPLLLIHSLGMSTWDYALWQLPIFGALIAGSFVLNYAVEKRPIERLLLLSLYPLMGGLLLALIATLMTDHIVALASGLSLYAFGLGITNATLFRITLYSSDNGKGAVSAMLGMISVTIFSLGSSLLAMSAAGDSPTLYIIGVSIPAFLAAIPLFKMLALPMQQKACQP